MQDENEYNNEIQRRKIHFSSKSVESEKIFLQQKVKSILIYDTIQCDMKYFISCALSSDLSGNF